MPLAIAACVKNFEIPRIKGVIHKAMAWVDFVISALIPINEIHFEEI